jgi:hypothetical protein
MGVAGQVVAQVAQGVLDGAEQLAVGQIDEFVGHAFEDGVGLSVKGLEDVLTALFTVM